jgi:hypothetical protein
MWEFAIGRTHYEFPIATNMIPADDFGDEAFSMLALEPGDAVIYKGVNYRHGRVKPNPNRWSAHLFLHWVDTEGPNKEWAFDRRPLPEPGEFPLPGEGATPTPPMRTWRAVP